MTDNEIAPPAREEPVPCPCRCGAILEPRVAEQYARVLWRSRRDRFREPGHLGELTLDGQAFRPQYRRRA